VHLILGEAVPLLNLAFEPFAIPVDDVKVVVSELSPLLFNFGSDLFPVSLQSILVHVNLHWQNRKCWDCRETGIILLYMSLVILVFY
jgi:hypothetical protein